MQQVCIKVGVVFTTSFEVDHFAAVAGKNVCCPHNNSVATWHAEACSLAGLKRASLSERSHHLRWYLQVDGSLTRPATSIALACPVW